MNELNYKVDFGRGIQELQARVAGSIERGWTPIGGVAVDTWGNLYQALTKNLKKEDGNGS